MLHEVWERWRDGLAGLGDAGLLAPIGLFGGWFADEPMAALVLHTAASDRPVCGRSGRGVCGAT
jgi:hypothetical protein